MRVSTVYGVDNYPILPYHCRIRTNREAIMFPKTKTNSKSNIRQVLTEIPLVPGKWYTISAADWHTEEGCYQGRIRSDNGWKDMFVKINGTSVLVPVHFFHVSIKPKRKLVNR
jgi:hypothetical protein